MSSRFPVQRNSNPFCWSCASTLPSLQQILFPLVQGLMAQVNINSLKMRRMLFYGSPLISGYILPFSTLLHGHIALAFPSLPATDPQILEHWGYADEDHVGKSFQAIDSGLECQRDVTRLQWIEHIGLASVYLSSSTKSMKTSAAPYLEIRNPIFVLLSKKPLHFCHHLFRLFAWLFINLAMCIRALVPKSASLLGLVEQAFWRMPLLTEWSGASSFEVILTRQSSHFPTWASASRTSGSPCISHTLLRRRSWRRIWLCRFCTLTHIVSETAIVSFWTLPVSFPLPTISWTSLFRLWSLGSREPQTTARVHLGRTTFPSHIRVIGFSLPRSSRVLSDGTHPFPERYLFSTRDHGRLRSNEAEFYHAPSPWAGLTVHWAVSSLSLQKSTTARWLSR